MKRHRRKFWGIVLHHTANPDPTTTSLERIRKHHVAKGWGDVGYHFLIWPDGRVDTGRSLKYRGAHVAIVRGKGKNRKVYSRNDGSIAIALVGLFTTEVQPTTAAILACVNLCRKLRIEHGQYLKGFGKHLVTLTHGEVCATLGFPTYTECPGPGWPEVVRSMLIPLPDETDLDLALYL